MLPENDFCVIIQLGVSSRIARFPVVLSPRNFLLLGHEFARAKLQGDHVSQQS